MSKPSALKAYSGLGFGDLYDGGEAIACLGKESPLDAFDTQCGNPGGVTVDGTSYIELDYATVPIRYLGNDDWVVTPIMGGLPLFLSGLAVLAGLMIHGRIGSDRNSGNGKA